MSLWSQLFGCGGTRRRQLDLILERLTLMSQQLDALRAAVNRNTTVDESAIELIRGLAAQIAALPADATAIAELAAELQAKSDALAAAVVANTPVA